MEALSVTSCSTVNFHCKNKNIKALNDNAFLPDSCEHTSSTVLTLNLENNEIAAIDDIHFKYLDKLMEINLKHNNIKKISSLLFQYNEQLVSIDLSNNIISEFELNLSPLKSLVKLDLSNNKLTTFDQNIFENYIVKSNKHQGRELLLHYNSLKCECDMFWVRSKELIPIEVNSDERCVQFNTKIHCWFNYEVDNCRYLEDTICDKG